jgi:hypothetical protein
MIVMDLSQYIALCQRLIHSSRVPGFDRVIAEIGLLSLSARELADRLDVPEPAIALWASGHSRPPAGIERAIVTELLKVAEEKAAQQVGIAGAH